MATEHPGKGPEAAGPPGGTGEDQELRRAPEAGGAQDASAGVPVTDDLAGLSAEQLRDRVRRTKQEAQRNWQHFLHAAADLENYKKQAARDRQDAVDRTRRQMLGLVLEVLDNLERALAFGGGPDGRQAEDRALVDGLRMTHRRILDQIAGIGVRPIDAVGKPFDPRLHEAVGVVAPGSPDQAGGTVASEVLRGYLLNGDVLRPAKVTVVAERRAEAQAEEGGGIPD